MIKKKHCQCPIFGGEVNKKKEEQRNGEKAQTSMLLFPPTIYKQSSTILRSVRSNSIDNLSYILFIIENNEAVFCPRYCCPHASWSDPDSQSESTMESRRCNTLSKSCHPLILWFCPLITIDSLLCTGKSWPKNVFPATIGRKRLLNVWYPELESLIVLLLYRSISAQVFPNSPVWWKKKILNSRL